MEIRLFGALFSYSCEWYCTLFYLGTIQSNMVFDRQLNNWLHDYLYKKNCPEKTGKLMLDKYKNRQIRNESEFKEMLKNVLSDC